MAELYDNATMSWTLVACLCTRAMYSWYVDIKDSHARFHLTRMEIYSPGDRADRYIELKNRPLLSWKLMLARQR